MLTYEPSDAIVREMFVRPRCSRSSFPTGRSTNCYCWIQEAVENLRRRITHRNRVSVAVGRRRGVQQQLRPGILQNGIGRRRRRHRGKRIGFDALRIDCTRRRRGGCIRDRNPDGCGSCRRGLRTGRTLSDRFRKRSAIRKIIARGDGARTLCERMSRRRSRERRLARASVRIGRWVEGGLWVMVGTIVGVTFGVPPPPPPPQATRPAEIHASPIAKRRVLKNRSSDRSSRCSPALFAQQGIKSCAGTKPAT